MTPSFPFARKVATLVGRGGEGRVKPMFNINKLPAILSVLFTLIIGFVEIINKDSFKIMAFKMLFTAIFFYIIGMLIRRIIVSAIGDVVNNKIAEMRGDNNKD